MCWCYCSFSSLSRFFLISFLLLVVLFIKFSSFTLSNGFVKFVKTRRACFSLYSMTFLLCIVSTYCWSAFDSAFLIIKLRMLVTNFITKDSNSSVILVVVLPEVFFVFYVFSKLLFVYSDYIVIASNRFLFFPLPFRFTVSYKGVHLLCALSTFS